MIDPAPKPPEVTNVLVALDDASSGRDTLEAAVRLASNLHAGIQGLYVEDATLLRIAGLPFVQEITAASGIARPIDAESMELAMQKKAEQIRQSMQHTAEEAEVRWTFSVTRGPALQKALSATSETDIIFFGCRRHVSAIHMPIVRRTEPVARPIVTVIDDPATLSKMLDTAEAVADRTAGTLAIVILAADRRSYAPLADSARQRLRETRAAAMVLPYPVSNCSMLVQSSRAQRGELMILSRACPVLKEISIESLIDRLECAVILA